METAIRRNSGLGLAILIGLSLVAAESWRWWSVQQTTANRDVADAATEDSHDHSGHAHAHNSQAHSGHDHGHDHHGHDHSAHGPSATPHDESNALRLSAEALRNVGLQQEQIRPVELTTYWKSLMLPAVVTERPGRTQLQVATPMTGLVTQVHVREGEAVSPGTLLFRIRLTHEDLLQLQTEFLRTIGELDVEEQEIRRLTSATQNQAVPGRLLLEREYERDKLTALRDAQRESLRLHGLSDQQLDSVIRRRRLIQELDVYAPHSTATAPAPDAQPDPVNPSEDTEQKDPLFVLGTMNVHRGQVVPAGTTLCVLKDYSQLLIEGYAFQQDIPAVRAALDEDRPISAVFEQHGGPGELLEGLRIEHLSNQVDPESRTVRFFVTLPNQQAGERRHQTSRFVEWSRLIGQRVQLRIPLKRWKNQIVLPRQAVAEEGRDSYVFRQHGEHFDRIGIRVKHRDALFVVVERDGAISPGNHIAWQGADRMQLALSRRPAGPVDAHHGHTH